MKYQLETIPVHDAWEDPEDPCPLCTLMDRAERRWITYYLGNSVMNPETRVRVNDTGFCPRHYTGLYGAGRFHHLGLLNHTHLGRWKEKLNSRLTAIRRSSSKTTVADFAGSIRKNRDSCLVCDALVGDRKRYCFTAVELHRQEEEFRHRFESSRGPCLPHAADLAEMALEVLSAKDRRAFLSVLAGHLETRLGELEADILHFTKKFDSQNDHLPWGTAKDAPARVIQTLTGRRLSNDGSEMAGE